MCKDCYVTLGCKCPCIQTTQMDSPRYGEEPGVVMKEHCADCKHMKVVRAGSPG
jgi:hypothetical protein